MKLTPTVAAIDILDDEVVIVTEDNEVMQTEDKIRYLPRYLF